MAPIPDRGYLPGMKPNPNSTIWAYWEGPLPPYIRLCIESMKRWNPRDYRLIGPDEALDLVGPLPSEVAGQHVVHRADWLRFELLYRHGGLWVDCDFICCETLAPLLGLAAAFDYIGHLEWDGGDMANFMVARAGSPILRSCADQALEVFRENPGGGIHWYAPNRYSVEHGIQAHRWKSVWMNIPTHLIEPVNVCDGDWFCGEPSPQETVAKFSCFGYMTSNQTIGPRLAGLSERDLLEGNRRVSHLLRHALRSSAAS